jgi:hypothetical protein
VEPTEKLPMTTMACHKIHIFAEDEMTFKAPIFDPEQFNKYGQAAEIVKLHIRMLAVTDDFTDTMPSHHNFVKSATESEDPPLNVSRSKGDQGTQLEALTEGKDSDARQDEGVHDDRHQKFTAPSHEITSPIDAAHKSIAMGEQNHRVKTCFIMFDEAHKGDVSKLYSETGDDNESSKRATEMIIMMHSTDTLKSAYSLRATVNTDDMRGIGSSKSCRQQAAAVPQGTGG